MATQKNKKTNVRLLKRFFIDGDLCDRIQVNRAENTVLLYNYNQHRTMLLVWSYVKKAHKRAWNKTEVAELLNRTRRTIWDHQQRGTISPQYVYNVNDPTHERKQYYFSDDDVLALHEAMSNMSKGRKRKDGGVKPSPTLPTRAELLGRMKYGNIFYVKTEDGRFVPAYGEVERWV